MVCVDRNIGCYCFCSSICRCIRVPFYGFLVSQNLCFTPRSVPPRSSLTWLSLDVLRNKSSRLEMTMYLLHVFVASGGFGCYRVGGARGAQIH